MKHFTVALAVAVALTGACKKSESNGAGGPGKPTAADCTKAFEHWAEVSAKKAGVTKEEKLSIQASNIANCPKTMSPAGVKCLDDLTESDVGTWPTCLGK